MAGRYKVTTNSIRNLIIEQFKDDKSIRTIGKLAKVSHSTVFAIIKRLKLRGTVENALKSGAPHKLIPRNRSFIMHEIEKNPRLGTTVELSEENFSLMKEQESYSWILQNPW
ncbi:hypothetical protein AVEN_126959-1 [Araneus ventricosus]|uniref:Paired domain-containing protein n=1 Tax=Araneus ventricosus TaxID=182803 RepID=A0A4Y2EBF4_ARAVE|nr:hypothetical protein AVEN_126959-1 [Araneus ventricosus]